VLIDLSRLNRVLELDPASAYVLLEPGVTFTDLGARLGADKLPFWLDSDENGAHSVLGSVCARAQGYTPYADHLLMQCGFEVVRPDGTVTRTGMGALPGNNTWQLFKYNFGPYIDGLFSRAEFGIVTKVGLWIMPAPPAWLPFNVSLPDRTAVGAAIDLLRPFKIDMSLPGNVVIAAPGRERSLLARAGKTASIDDDHWQLYGALVGLPGNVDFAWSALGPALAALPGAQVVSGADARSDALWRLRCGLMRGVPAYNDTGRAAEPRLSFSATAPLEGSDAQAMLAIADDKLGSDGIRHEFMLGWRTLFLNIEIAHDETGYAARRDAALACTAALAGAGYAISHDSPDLSLAIAGQQTAPALAQLYEHLAGALDPGRILRG